MKSNQIKAGDQWFWWGLVILLPLLYFPIFMHLTYPPLFLWDESRVATNALEMYQHGHWLVPHFDGTPDMWNTKPPLLVWLQALGMFIFGPTELAVRLPSAIAGLATVIALYTFSCSYFKSLFAGLAAALVLVTTFGFLEMHNVRTGDYDALLTLLTTLQVLFFYLYIERSDQKWLIYFIAALTGAALTKGISGLLFIPAFFIYALIRRKITTISRSRVTWVGIAFFGLLVGGYYLLREWQNPGYLHAVMENELGGRYFETLEGHRQPFFHYFHNLLTYRIGFWLPFALLGFLVIPITPIPKKRALLSYLLITIIVYLVIISVGKTRVWWYDIPVIPLLALAAASTLHDIYRALSQYLRGSWSKILGYVMLGIFTLYAFTHLWKLVYFRHTEHVEEKVAGYVRASLAQSDIKFCFLDNRHITNARFYSKAKYGSSCEVALENLPADRNIIIFNGEDQRYLKDHYNWKLMDSFNGVEVYQVKSRTNDIIN